MTTTQPFIIRSLAPSPEEMGRELGLSREHVESVRRIMRQPVTVKYRLAAAQKSTARGTSDVYKKYSSSGGVTGKYHPAATKNSGAKKASSGRTKSSSARAAAS